MWAIWIGVPLYNAFSLFVGRDYTYRQTMVKPTAIFRITGYGLNECWTSEGNTGTSRPCHIHVKRLFFAIITNYLMTISDSPDKVRRLFGASIERTGVFGRSYCSSFWIVYLPREVPVLTFY